jgi:AraC family transcriptional activator of pobA
MASALKRRPDLKSYSIFGTAAGAEGMPDLHIEALQARAAEFGYSVEPHVHPGMLQLILALRGHCALSLDDSRQEVIGPCVVSIPGGVAHSFDFQSDVSGWVLTVAHNRVFGASPSARENVVPLLRRPYLIEYQGQEDALHTLASLLRHLHQEFYSELPERTACLEYLLRLVLVNHWREVGRARMLPSALDRERSLFYQFRALVEQHYSKHWPMARYLGILRCSHDRLTQVCHLVTQSTPHGVILQRLAEEAKRLLVFTTATSADIGERLGFQEPSYFTRFFRRHTGMTPGAFRLKHDQSRLRRLE